MSKRSTHARVNFYMKGCIRILLAIDRQMTTLSTRRDSIGFSLEIMLLFALSDISNLIASNERTVGSQNCLPSAAPGMPLRNPMREIC